MSDKEAKRKPPRFGISLRSIFLLVTLVFVIGYQQHRIHQMESDLIQLRQDHEELAKQSSSLNVVTVPVYTSSPNQKFLFPREVEEAMMGDAQPGRSGTPAR